MAVILIQLKKTSDVLKKNCLNTIILKLNSKK